LLCRKLWKVEMRFAEDMTDTRRTQRAGFTLVEVLLVVMIVALVAGVGGGIYVGTYKRLLVEKAARGFVLGARYARIKAVERQSPCIMKLDTKNEAFGLLIYAMVENAGETTLVALRDSYFKKPVEFADGVEFEHVSITAVGGSDSAQGDEIVFAPDGTAQWAVVQIGNGSNHYTVSINGATGKARMQFGVADSVETGPRDLERR